MDPEIEYAEKLAKNQFEEQIHYDDSKELLNMLLCAKWTDHNNIIDGLGWRIYGDAWSDENKRRLIPLIGLLGYYWKHVFHQPNPHNKSDIWLVYRTKENDQMKRFLDFLYTAEDGILIWKEFVYKFQFTVKYAYDTMDLIFEAIDWQLGEMIKSKEEINDRFVQFTDRAVFDLYRMMMNHPTKFRTDFITSCDMIKDDHSRYGIIAMTNLLTVHIYHHEECPDNMYIIEEASKFIIPLQEDDFARRFIWFSLLSPRYMPILLRWIYIIYTSAHLENSEKALKSYEQIIRILQRIIEWGSKVWIENDRFKKNVLKLTIFMFDLREKFLFDSGPRLFPEGFSLSVEFVYAMAEEFAMMSKFESTKHHQVCFLKFVETWNPEEIKLFDIIFYAKANDFYVDVRAREVESDEIQNIEIRKDVIKKEIIIFLCNVKRDALITDAKPCSI